MNSRSKCLVPVPTAPRSQRCLAEKMGDPDFGDVCREEVVAKLQRRQANWKLDPPLRKACKQSVEGLCNAEDKKNSEQVIGILVVGIFGRLVEWNLVSNALNFIIGLCLQVPRAAIQ